MHQSFAEQIALISGSTSRLTLFNAETTLYIKFIGNAARLKSDTSKSSDAPAGPPSRCLCFCPAARSAREFIKKKTSILIPSASSSPVAAPCGNLVLDVDVHSPCYCRAPQPPPLARAASIPARPHVTVQQCTTARLLHLALEVALLPPSKNRMTAWGLDVLTDRVVHVLTDNDQIEFVVLRKLDC